MNLKQLRQSLRDQRKKLSAEIVSVASESVAKKIIALPEFLNSKHIALYFSNENEIDPAEIAHYAQQRNKKIYFPVFENKQLFFYRVDQNTQYIKNQFNILEPIHLDKDFFPIEKIDLFLIPLVAFDEACHRVGRGLGCYDRALILRQKNAMLIGLAYEFQKVDRIIPESWDIAMDKIVTEENKYHRTPAHSANHAISQKR